MQYGSESGNCLLLGLPLLHLAQTLQNLSPRCIVQVFPTADTWRTILMHITLHAAEEVTQRLQ